MASTAISDIIGAPLAMVSDHLRMNHDFTVGASWPNVLACFLIIRATNSGNTRA
jgi:hypothetical protein